MNVIDFFFQHELKDLEMSRRDIDRHTVSIFKHILSVLYIEIPDLMI